MKFKLKKNLMNRRKMQYGSISVLLTVAFVACIILVNAGISFLSDRYNLKADISGNGLYEISEQTEAMLKNLKEPVTAYILMSESDVQNSSGYAQANELLKRYEGLSGGNFHIEYVDVYKNPTFVQKYEQDGSTISSGSFIIESPKRYKVAALSDLYEWKTDSSSGSQYASGFTADENFASALHFVTTDDLPSAVKIVGHGETYDDDFIALFTSSNYTMSEVNLSMEDIPDGTALILIGSPTTDYTAEEITKLDNYLTNKAGNAMVFTDTMSPKLETLERYFGEWGVAYTNTMVVDMQRAISDPTWIVPDIKETDVVENFTHNSNTMVLMPYSRALEALWDTRSSRTVTEVLSSSQYSYAKAYSADSKIESYDKADGDVDGPLPVVLLSEQKKYDGTTPVVSHVMFFSTSNIVNSTMLTTSSLSNKQFITAALNYMNPVVDAVSIEPRDLTSDTMTILTEQAQVIMVLLVVVLPLIVLALGVVMWLKRRNM